MAYMSQEKKAVLTPSIKAVLNKFNMKGTIKVDRHSTLVVNVKSGPLDLITNFVSVCSKLPQFHPYAANEMPSYVQVNPYWAHEHFSGKCKNFVVELLAAMNAGNHDKSDIQSDYFDVGWYVSVNIGNWNRPYICEKEVAYA